MNGTKAGAGMGTAVIASLLFTISAFPDALISEDYESGQLIGGLPVGAAEVLPTTPTTNISTLVVGGADNVADTGNGVRIYVNAAVSGAGCRLEYDLMGSAPGQLSAVRIDFSFAAASTSTSGSFIKFSAGEYGVTQTSSSTRFMDCRLYADGTINFVSSLGPDRYNNTLLSSNNTLSVIINDLDAEAITYAGPDATTNSLAANSVAYWLNGSLMLETLLENRTTANGTVFGSTNNIGRISFISGSTDYGLDYVVDNIEVVTLLSVTPPPEPPARLHTLFQDHMMLQRDLAVPVWGMATPGLEVEVLLDDVPAGSAVADEAGDWRVDLVPHENGGGVSHALEIQVSNEVQQVVSDVIFGDVYLCSGQSNMEFLMSEVAGFAELYADDYNPLIRHVAIERGKSATELFEPAFEQAWSTANPASIANFTAIGYLFAKEIYARTGVPVGLLNSSYGGQRIKCFLNAQGLEKVPELAGFVRHAEEGGVSEVSTIYNAQIAPLLPFGICGFLWYQGETDRLDPIQYEERMRALMRGWRSVWGFGDLPFYYCQLPTYNTVGYSAIRDGQLRALSETNCGMAVLIDVGDDTNIHPVDKQDPAFRLVQWALVGRYGTNVVYSGPVYLETQQEGSQIRVLFDYAEGGLMIGRKDGTNALVAVPGGPLQCFEVAGSNRVFVAAEAVIDADTVLVSAPSVPLPEYVRYCYPDISNGSNRLYNAAGLPAAAFRSDHSFELFVANGSGSADPVLPGVVVGIAANAPLSGRVFDRWIGGGTAISDANAAAATVTMPDRDLYVIATYRDSGATAYTLTVNNGNGDGTAQAGSIMEIMADPPPFWHVFDGWVGDTQAVADVRSAFTTLQMPASNITLTATYRFEIPVPPAAPEFVGMEALSGGVSMWSSSEPGLRYELERSTSLDEMVWEPALYNVRGDGFDKLLAVPVSGDPRGFYRLKVK